MEMAGSERLEMFRVCGSPILAMKRFPVCASLSSFLHLFIGCFIAVTFTHSHVFIELICSRCYPLLEYHRTTGRVRDSHDGALFISLYIPNVCSFLKIICGWYQP
jgi:hypothetical protein